MTFRSSVVLLKPAAALNAILSWSGPFLLLCDGGTGWVFAGERHDCSPESTARNLQEAHAYMSRGEYAQSERVFGNVLSCQRQSLAVNDLNIAVTLGNLGELKRLQRQFRAAETLLKEAGSLHETAGRTIHVAFGTALLSLASVFKDRKQYHLAEPLVRRAMQIFDHSPGPESREAAAAMNTLAVLYAESGNLDSAERHFRTALARRQNSPPDVSTATVQHNLGKILVQMGRVGDAEEWLLKALDLRSQLLGNRHPATRLTLSSYESLLRRTGRKVEASQIGKGTQQESGLVYHK